MFIEIGYYYLLQKLATVDKLTNFVTSNVLWIKMKMI